MLPTWSVTCLPIGLGSSEQKGTVETLGAQCVAPIRASSDSSPGPSQLQLLCLPCTRELSMDLLSGPGAWQSYEESHAPIFVNSASFTTQKISHGLPGLEEEDGGTGDSGVAEAPRCVRSYVYTTYPQNYCKRWKSLSAPSR